MLLLDLRDFNGYRILLRSVCVGHHKALESWANIVREVRVVGRSVACGCCTEENIVLTYNPGGSFETCDTLLFALCTSFPSARDFRRFRTLKRSSVLDPGSTPVPLSWTRYKCLPTIRVGLFTPAILLLALCGSSKTVSEMLDTSFLDPETSSITDTFTARLVLDRVAP